MFYAFGAVDNVRSENFRGEEVRDYCKCSTSLLRAHSSDCGKSRNYKKLRQLEAFGAAEVIITMPNPDTLPDACYRPITGRGGPGPDDTPQKLERPHITLPTKSHFRAEVESKSNLDNQSPYSNSIPSVLFSVLIFQVMIMFFSTGPECFQV